MSSDSSATVKLGSFRSPGLATVRDNTLGVVWEGLLPATLSLGRGLYEVEVRNAINFISHDLRVRPPKPLDARHVGLPLTTIVPVASQYGRRQGEAEMVTALSAQLRDSRRTSGLAVVIVGAHDSEISTQCEVRHEEETLFRVSETRQLSVGSFPSGRATAVDPGGYSLRLEGTERSNAESQGLHIPLWVSEGYQTLVFVPNGGTRLDRTSIHMLPIRHTWTGFEVGSLLLEGLLAARRRGVTALTFHRDLDLDRLVELYPLLGLLLTTHLEENDSDEAIIANLVSRLKDIVPGHPDLIAIEGSGHIAFPATIASLQELSLRDVVTGAASIASGSTAETAMEGRVRFGAWTTWAEQWLPATSMVADAGLHESTRFPIHGASRLLTPLFGLIRELIELPNVVKMGRQLRSLDAVDLHARLAQISDGKDLPTVRVFDHIRFLLETGDVDAARRTLQGRRVGETAAAVLLSAASVHKALDRVGRELRRTLDDETRARRSTGPDSLGRTARALPEATAVTDELSSGARGPFVPHFGLALLVVAAAQLMVGLDLTIVNVALPTIQKALGFSGPGLEWVVNAYALTFGSLLLLGQRVSNILGSRRVLVAGALLISLASLLGGLATSPSWLVAARALQGAAGAIIAPTIFSQVIATFPRDKPRHRAIAVFATVSGLSMVGGLMTGGLLTTYLSWRSVFFVNVPLGITVALLAPRVLRKVEGSWGRFDLPGAITGTLGLAALVYGLSSAGSTSYSGTSHWGDPVTIVSLIAGVTLLTSFVFIEARSPHALMPLRIFRDRNRSGVYLIWFCVTTEMFGLFFFLTLFMQNVWGYNALKTGVAYLPMIGTMTLMAGTSRQIARRIGAMPLLLVGSTFVAGGMTWLSRISEHSSYTAGVLGSTMIAGAGIAMLFVPLNLIATSQVDARDAGLAGQLIRVDQQVGGSVGLAALGIAAWTVVAQNIRDQVAAAVEAGHSAAVTSTIYDHAVSIGFSLAFELCAAIMLMAIIIALITIRVTREDLEGAPPVAPQAMPTADWPSPLGHGPAGGRQS